MFKTNAIVAAALCTVGLFSAPTAFAATAQVRYSDLDLTTDAGQKTLENRLQAAARSVCRAQRPTTGTHLSASVDAGCYKQALAQVRAQVATAIDGAGDTRLGG
ncbi:UrcA family protein [Novosphingobium soli]|uniref:UrcA family protein n=1 Tax=Novosphingobium soli TaxID=574956 RepID=A0ABV6D0M2_9SPHN